MINHFEARKHGHAYEVKCASVGHSDMRRIRVGHVTWYVVDQMTLNIFHEFFSLVLFF